MKHSNYVLLGLLALTATPALAQPMPGSMLSTRDPNGVYCREYQQKVVVGGILSDSYGTACEQPDGQWKIVTTDQQPEANDDIDYVEAPRYITPPRYVVPPAAYYTYEPYPYYVPYYRPSYSSGIYFNFSDSYGRGGHHGGYHGGSHHGWHH